MGKHFLVNDAITYRVNPRLLRNDFWNKVPEEGKLPTYEEVRAFLPRPVWEGHPSAIDCWDKAWEIAFRNLRKAKKEAGFVSDFIDTAFNGYLFMWDSSFIVQFGRYASRQFSFQKTLDNFYSHQHKDGFICREICEDEPGEQFARDDPASTGPNVLPWAEWRYYASTGDKDRLARVFDPLCAYHWWLMMNRSWPDGSYWSCGWGCGMDNQPRVPEGYDVSYSHGHMSWIDACAQMRLSASILVRMAKELGREDETAWLKEEDERLSAIVNGTMWDEAQQFYFDKYRDGSLGKTKTVGAYWTLLAGLVPPERIAPFVDHLRRENEFKRHNRVPALSADHPKYSPEGDYWNGGVWAPTNYMVLEGLFENGYGDLAHEIAQDYVSSVVRVFEKTGTLWENYAPDSDSPGKPAGKDFVGWTGLAPIAVLLEHVFGIRPDASERKILWDLRLTEKHGVEKYQLGDATVRLLAGRRKSEEEEPEIVFESDRPASLTVRWRGGEKTLLSPGGRT